MDIVYIETTVVGSIAGRMHPNPDVASRLADPGGHTPSAPPQQCVCPQWPSPSRLTIDPNSLTPFSPCTHGEKGRG